MLNFRAVQKFGSRSSKINKIKIMLSHYDRNKIEIMENKLLKLVGRVIDA